MRTILVTGKGGVGKTTLSAATALMIARSGRRVLVVSTDGAHSLGDVLDRRLGPEPVPVADRLDAAHIDGRVEFERSWEAIADYVRALLGWAEIDRLHADELVVVPGLDQLLALSRLGALHDTEQWDALVVDCAPSADSLRLLALPDVLGWYVDRLFGRRGPVGGWLRKRVERNLAVPCPDEQTVDAISALASELAKLRKVVHAPSTSTRLVLTPERVVVAEARRMLAYLALYGHRVDAVLVNRVLPTASTDPILVAWAEEQRRVLDTVRNDFHGLAHHFAPHLGAEPGDTDALARLGAALYGEADPAGVLSSGQSLSIETRGSRSVVRVPALGIDRRDITVDLVANELIITMGNQRRPVTLPDALAGHVPVRGTMGDGHFEVHFEAAEVANAR